MFEEFILSMHQIHNNESFIILVHDTTNIEIQWHECVIRCHNSAYSNSQKQNNCLQLYLTD